MYRNEVFETLQIGQQKTGYLKRIRDDGKLDVSLQPLNAVAGMDASRASVLQKLSEVDGGYLPYHDKSDPVAIERAFGLSKKAFKRAIGGLYKDKQVSLEDGGIRLIESKRS